VKDPVVCARLFLFRHRILLSVPPLVSGIATLAKRQLLAVHGQYRRLRLLPYGGESSPFALLGVESDYLPSTVRRLRELTEA
jgi:hypothetical protein